MGLPIFPLINGVFHSLNGFKQTPLTDNSDLSAETIRCFQHAIAGIEGGGHGFLNQHMDAELRGSHAGGLMFGVWRADHQSLKIALPKHLFDIGEALNGVLFSEGVCTARRRVANSNELRLRQATQRKCMGLPDFSATDETSSEGEHDSLWS